MTQLLKKAFEKAAREMSEREQDEFARWLLEAIERDEKNWDTAFARSQGKLQRLARKALDDLRSGRAKPLKMKDL